MSSAGTASTTTKDRAPGHDGRLRLRVGDTGIGITADALARLIQPFEQADSSMSRCYGGSGLGLTIARRLLDLMGGTIGVASQPKAGTEVTIEVPVQRVTAAPVDAQPQTVVTANDAPAASGGPLCVLLVEDNPVNRLLASEMLKRLKCAVNSAVTGRQAVDTAMSGAWDLVLMDWPLPGIDGLKATRRIRAWERGQGRVGMHIVALTANAMPGDRDRCIEAGCNDDLAKPFSLAQLRAVIDRLSARAQTAPR